MIKILQFAPRRRNGLLSNLVLAAILTGLLFSGCSSDDSSGQGTAMTLITNANGGTYDAGSVWIAFPPDSVAFDVLVTGTVVETGSIPPDITPLSEVHQISLSDADAYNADTAVISFDLDQSGEGIFVFHSGDGIQWNIIGGIFEGTTVSANVPGFSYFFAGKVTSPREQHTLTFRNDSNESGSVCIYQYNRDVGSYQIMPLAWFAKYTYPNTQIRFTWSQAYSFCWAMTGQLRPGVLFRSSQTANADLSSYNQITLEGSGGYYSFTNQTSGPYPGRLFIRLGGGIQMDEISVGIGMSGSPIYAMQAMPNWTVAFDPSSPKYWITFGNYRLGEVLDHNSVTNRAEIVFPEGVYSMTAVLRPDLTWVISPGSDQ